MKKVNHLLILIFSSIIACSGAKENVAPNEPTDVAVQESQDENQNVQVAGLWGKIDDSIVEETFQQHFNAFLECYQYEALDVLEEIEGELSVYLIVGPDGGVTDEIYFEDGTLGSEATQSCVISKIKRIRFQEPIGGNNARVRYSFPFEEPYGHPAPIDWSEDEQFLKTIEEHQEEIDACLGGGTGVKFVIYVGRGGRVEAAGGTSESQAGYEAGRCIAQAAKSWKFKNPGKRRPAKATIYF
ncbi:MAG: AgmX/PglI C-terminal domain-containing protein [Deltaproteobacteria bacterium]|nr:AgmX/PglI C-terminal domain-containing protein [Deltaproteobacteria bacterium]MBN2672783.1 AgmX/PglI C-terminal domain-containing protein [Deltaproteobacteria bacterium]